MFEDMYRENIENLYSLTDNDAPPQVEASHRLTEKISAKLKHSQTELENNKRLLEKSNSDFDAKINELQAEYDSKKNKDTKAANSILRRIEVLKRRKGSIEADYLKRIGGIEKINVKKIVKI